jgi:hypothetical protein
MQALLTSLWTTILLMGLLPTVYAAPDQTPFPNITFGLFADFVNHNFCSNISLATVLTVLFTLTNNTDLRNLHS